MLEDQLKADKAKKIPKPPTMTSQAVCQHPTSEQEMCETLLPKHREITSLRDQKASRLMYRTFRNREQD